MLYPNIKEAIFQSRPNRFIAHILLDGKPEIAHVKNTGRCRELLRPGSPIFVQEAENKNRKTKYDLISVYKGDTLINMDSQAPNKVFAQWVSEGQFLPELTLVKPEARYGNSRLDFYLETKTQKIFAEVKGVTLEENGIARFPDAPTLRGVRHLQELCAAAQEGYGAYAVFVVQMGGITHFEPNDQTHPAFGEALRRAAKQGVHLLALDCAVEPDSLCIRNPVEIRL